MKRKTLFGIALPVVVALVLGSSLIASAGDKANHPVRCGPGYTQSDNDENGHEQGQNNDTKSRGEDNDRCEDEQGGEDNGGGGGDNGGDNDRGGGRDGGRVNDRGGGR